MMHRSDDQLDLDTRERACVNFSLFRITSNPQCGSKLTDPPHQLHKISNAGYASLLFLALNIPANPRCSADVLLLNAEAPRRG